jgi:hypothetical protein
MWNALADEDVFVMPGSMMNAKAYFRISLTASDEMVARALPAFERATVAFSSEVGTGSREENASTQKANQQTAFRKRVI